MGGEKVLGKSVNMMSCGGVSSQDAYAAQLDPVVNRVPADLGGTFCVIEFFCVFVERCIKALVGQVVPIADALAAIDNYLDEWYVSAPAELRKPDDSEINEAGGVTWGSKKRFVVH